MKMPASDRLSERVPLITALVHQAPAGFGRTALMKCLYLVQTVRGVPLGYHFRLYTYGPFDSDVLSDLSLAERLGAVESELLQYPGGHKYELRGGTKAEQMIAHGRNYLDQHKDDVDWVLQAFAGRSARDLENASTLIFTDRSAIDQGHRLTLTELVRKVHEVKPHLPTALIEQEARSLKDQGLLGAH
jgi:hypothetical protein